MNKKLRRKQLLIDTIIALLAVGLSIMTFVVAGF